MPKVNLLTGGTGFLGSLLSLELIERGKEIIFLGRSKNGEPFPKRIEKVLRSIKPAVPLEKIKAIEVDLCGEDQGFPQRLADQLPDKIEAIWCLAADLSFKEKDRRRVFATNLGGLKNILNLASYLKCPVYYTSTAYVHGRRPGVIFEDELIKSNSFNNPYEESKFEAETMIKKWGEDGNKFIIFRPSILVERERRVMSFFGYYAVVYALYKLKKALGKERADIRIFFPFPYSRRTYLNLMPIDIAINWMIEISMNPGAFGKTFHIVNPYPFPMKKVVEQTFDALHLKVPIVSAPPWLIKLSFSIFNFIGQRLKPIQSLAKMLYYFRYYMTQYNVYDLKNSKEILGKDPVVFFHFPTNFVSTVAAEFIAKLYSNNERSLFEKESIGRTKNE